ncbi:MAG: DsbC family protein [Gammaproteobacteria bacterium]|nr:DsbC family protein [Gammaproteobacteria bacterium]
MRMKQNVLLTVMVLLLTGVSTVMAAADPKKTLSALLPGVQLSSVVETPIPGLYEVIADGELRYMTLDARFLIDGVLIDRKLGQNLTANKQNELLRVVLKDFLQYPNDKNTITFQPAGKTKHTLNIFTDISCGYCRKLHSEMAELNKAGVKVRYLLYPRAGLSTPSSAELESVWCADSRTKAMDIAKTGGRVEAKTCSNPIKDHVAWANKLSLRGTPMLITDKGTVIPGWKPAAELIQILANGG